MPIPRELTSTLSPAEAEFAAEAQLVTIAPLQRMPRIQLIAGSFGPFRPPRKCRVPLWLAVALKRRAKCVIEPPGWLSISSFTQLIDLEKNRPEFSALPHHYMELAHILLETAPEDIPNASALRTLLKDFRDIRLSKSRIGLRNLDPHYLQMDNLGAMEINEIRPSFTAAFNQLRKFVPVDDSAATGDAINPLGGSQDGGVGLAHHDDDPDHTTIFDDPTAFHKSTQEPPGLGATHDLTAYGMLATTEVDQLSDPDDEVFA